MQNKKGFTMAELIVVISVLIILSTIATISIRNISVDSRNSARISNLRLISAWLENHKSKNSILPVPWDIKNITNSWTIIVNQWLFNKDVNTLEIQDIPKDPLTKNNYIYSTTENKLLYQLGASIEDKNYDKWFRAYVVWNYKQVHKQIPSLMIANISDNFDLSSSSWAFIVHNWSFNLPYLRDSLPYSWNTNLDEIINENWVEILKYAWFKDCQDIIDNNMYLWHWEYYWSWNINCN